MSAHTNHPGLLGAISEALEIQQTEGVSSDEAWRLQRQRAGERLREAEQAAELDEAVAESNVIPFRQRH